MTEQSFHEKMKEISGSLAPKLQKLNYEESVFGLLASDIKKPVEDLLSEYKKECAVAKKEAKISKIISILSIAISVLTFIYSILTGYGLF